MTLDLEKIKTGWEFPYQNEGDQQLEDDMRALKARYEAFVADFKPRTDWLNDPIALREALDRYEEIIKLGAAWGWPRWYAELRVHQDKNNSEAKAFRSRIRDWSNDIFNTALFFRLRLGKIPVEVQERMLQASSLASYRHFLVRLFQEAGHRLSEETEQALTLLHSNAMQSWVDMLDQLTSKDEIEVLQEDGTVGKVPISAAGRFLQSQKKEVRDRANEAVVGVFKAWASVAEHEINAVLSFRKAIDQLRHFERPDASRHLDDDIDAEVVDALVGAVRSRYNISRRYMELKAALMGYRPIGYHERLVPYGRLGGNYSFQEAVELVHRVMSGLHPRFAQIFSKLFSEGRVDAFPRTSKTGGAFHWRLTKGIPPYLLFNFTGKLRDVKTIAHETGHVIHGELSAENQHALHAGYPTSTAEVASTFFEDFVMEDIRRTADEETRLAILLMQLDSDMVTIFHQIAGYGFEQAMHRLYREKGHATLDKLGALHKEHMMAYLGEAVTPNEVEIRWIGWPHLRRYFYIYSYASGLLISKALQNMVREDYTNIEKLVAFLSAGSSDSPRNILAHLGIDWTGPTLWMQGLDEVDRLVDKAYDLAERLGKI